MTLATGSGAPDQGSGQCDLYPPSCREMRPRFGFLLRPFAERFFKPIRFSTQEEDLLQGLARQGHLVYVMSSASLLHYLFLNFWCLQLQLPLAAYGNGIPFFLLFQPLRRVLRAVRARITAWTTREKWRSAEGLSTADCGRSFQDGKSVVLFLRHSPLLRKSGYRESKSVLETLLTLQARTETPIFLIPIGILWGKRPEKVEKSVVDTLLGDREAPGFLRQLLMLSRYSRHSLATVGQVTGLRDFLERNAHVEEELLGKKLRWTLHRELTLAKQQVTGPRLKPRKHIVRSILSSRTLREQAREIARSEGKSFDRVMKRAARHANEIVADYNSTYIRFLDKLLTWVWNNLFSGFHVDEEGIERVKKACRKGSLILLPCHKSHIDYLVLSYIFYYHDLPLPHIAAGVNLSFWPLGHVFRKAGAFFIRRSFRGVPLYSAVFSVYIRRLLREGYVQEFFIEGTRSRTGKLLYPKLGMLSMEIEAYSEGTAQDAFLVPISITYDKVVEETSYLKESEGGRKEKERFRDLLRTPRFLKRKYGRVYLQFAPPVSLREYGQARLVDFGRLTAQRRQAMVEDLALRVCHAINQVTTVTPSALVATVLLNHPARGITRDALLDRVGLLLSLLRDLAAPVSLSLQKLPWAVEEALGVFLSDRIVQRWDDPEGAVYMFEEANRIQLNYYKNNILHYFLPFALASAVYRQHGDRSLHPADLLEGFDFLRHLFAREFIFPPEDPAPTLWRLVREWFCENRGVIGLDEQGRLAIRDPGMLRYFGTMLDPFLESYYLALHASARILQEEECEERSFFKKLRESADRLYRRGDLLRAESKSIFLLRNAAASMVMLGFLDRREKGGRARYSLSTEGNLKMQECLGRLSLILGFADTPQGFSGRMKTP